MGTSTTEVNDTSFEAEVIKSKLPVLVDFWAEWCAPCRALAPTLEVLARDYQGRVKVLKLNVDQNISTSSRYNIKGVPTLLLFKDGMVKEQIVGVAGREGIAKFLDKHL
jgi:thioredoxin